jgi:ornithine carbamoyltransferase
MANVRVEGDIAAAIRDADIVLTDPLSGAAIADFAPYQITAELLRTAHPNALLNPCPPFYRGEEVSADAINSEFFVGYDFKQSLVKVQQAVLLWCTVIDRGAL